MNLNPYHHDVESVVFADEAWQSRIDFAEAEREAWKSRAIAAETQLRLAKKALSRSVAPGECASVDCSERIHSYATVPLCADHLRAAHVDMELIWADQARHEPEKLPAEVRERLEYRRPWVVYYIRMGSRVKIGRTVDLAKRMKTFAAHPDQLLAVEPGVIVEGVDRETQRHREFAHLRVAGMELFEDAPELRAHIAEVVAVFGEPSRHLVND